MALAAVGVFMVEGRGSIPAWKRANNSTKQIANPAKAVPATRAVTVTGGGLAAARHAIEVVDGKFVADFAVRVHLFDRHFVLRCLRGVRLRPRRRARSCAYPPWVSCCKIC